MSGTALLQFEVARSGRNLGHWWLRMLYITALMLCLIAVFRILHVSMPLWSDIRGMRFVAVCFYDQFCYCQLFAVLLLSPIIAIQRISEEKQTRTLELLLCTQLSVHEIVGSKLAVALLRVWEVILGGLPFCALCLLLGGLSPGRILADFSLAFAAATAGCGLGLLAAVWTRRFLDALLVVLLFQLAWYAAPTVCWWLTLSRVVSASLPLTVGEFNAFHLIARTGLVGQPLQIVVVPALSMVAAGIFFAFGACLGLRRFTKRPESHSPVAWLDRFMQRESLPVTGEPMLWRELIQRRGTLAERLMVMLAFSLIFALVTVSVLFWSQGQREIREYAGGVYPTVAMMAGLTGMIYIGLLGLPFLGVVGATAFSQESSRRLFDFLRSTNLTQREIVGAKARRMLRLVLLVVSGHLVPVAAAWLIGFTSALAFIHIAVHTIAAALCISILGMYLSLRMRKTATAVVLVLAVYCLLSWVTPIMLLATASWNKNQLSLWAAANPGLQTVIFLESDNNLPSRTRVRSSLTRSFSDISGASVMASLTLLGLASMLYKRCLKPIGPWMSESTKDGPVVERDRNLAASMVWFFLGCLPPLSGLLLNLIFAIDGVPLSAWIQGLGKVLFISLLLTGVYHYFRSRNHIRSTRVSLLSAAILMSVISISALSNGSLGLVVGIPGAIFIALCVDRGLSQCPVLDPLWLCHLPFGRRTTLNREN